MKISFPSTETGAEVLRTIGLPHRSLVAGSGWRNMNSFVFLVILTLNYLCVFKIAYLKVWVGISQSVK
jgi:hypothetical protein